MGKLAERVIILRCSKCNLPFAKIQNSCIIIESSHHGEKHINAVAIDELVRMCGLQPQPDSNE